MVLVVQKRDRFRSNLSSPFFMGMMVLLVVGISGLLPRVAIARQAEAATLRLDRVFNKLDAMDGNTDDGIDLVARPANQIPDKVTNGIEQRQRAKAGQNNQGPAVQGSLSSEDYRGLFLDDIQRFGAASLLPAVVALGLAFLTKDVLLSLFAGVVSGAFVQFFQARVVTGLWLPKELDFIENFFLRALGTSSYATILLVYLWFLGGIVGIWGKTGAAKHFAEVVGKKVVRGPNTARFFAWLVGIVFHQGGTVSTVLAGSTVRPVSDRHRVSHEELSYIVDSTASPVATIVPFNAWPFYIGGIVAGATAPEIGQFVLIADEATGRDWFFNSIKFNCYGILAVLFTLLFSFGLLPIVGSKMRKAIKRAREEGKLDDHESSPLVDPKDLEGDPSKEYRVGLEDFVVPLGLLLVIAIGPPLGYWLGLFPQRIDLIKQAFLASTIGAIVIAVIKGMPLKTVMTGFLDGCKSMTIGAIILGLAVTLGQVSKDLNAAGFIVGVFGSWLPPILLPALLTLCCMVIAFAVGSSWSTYAVIFPIAVPLALALGARDLGADPSTIAQIAENGGAQWSALLIYVQICFGAVIGGAVFGDQCSPISDTTVLSSMFTGCDLMDHVTTQAPIALIAAGLGAIISTLLVLIF